MKHTLLGRCTAILILWLQLWFSFIVFVPFLVFLLFSMYVIPSGDDWGFGVLAKNIGGNLGTMLHYYFNYHGRYFSHLLIPLSMNFDTDFSHYRFFVSGHYIAFFTSILYFCHQLNILGKRVWTTWANFLMTGIMFSTLILTHRRPNETFFWFSQIANYALNIPLLFFFCGTILHHRNIMDTHPKKAVILSTLATLLSIIIIGTCEPSAFLQTALVGYLGVYLFFTEDKQWPHFQYVLGASIFFFLVVVLSLGHEYRMLVVLERNEKIFGPLKDDFFGSIIAAIPLYRQMIVRLASNRSLLFLNILLVLFPLTSLITPIKSKQTRRHLMYLFLGFFLLIQFTGMAMIAAHIFKSGNAAAHINNIMTDRVRVPIMLYYYFSYIAFIAAFLCYFLPKISNQPFFKKMQFWHIGVILKILLLALFCHQVANNRIMETMVRYIPQLKKYAIEQDYRVRLIKESLAKGESKVHLPKLTSRMPYSYYDIEEEGATQFGFRDFYASFFGVEKVMVTKEFIYCNHRICGVQNHSKLK